MKKCILCSNTRFRNLFSINNAPRDITKLLTEKEFQNDKKIKIKLVQCLNCELIQLTNNVLEQSKDFYDDYIMTTTHSAYMIGHRNKQADYLIKRFKLEGRHIIDIGSGDGNYCSILKTKGAIPCGVEPSKVSYREAITSFPQIKFINDYLTDKTRITKNFFDAWVARQVFEHLINPNDILSNIKLFIKKDAIGLIEIPSFEYTRKLRRYYDIFPDHVAYYTKQTLQRLLTTNGYEVIEIRDEADGEYLAAYFKNMEYEDKENENFFQDYSLLKKRVREVFLKLKGKKVGAWGAGGRGNAFYSLFNLSGKDLQYVIDSDPHKQNKFTIGSHILVVSPNKENILSLDAIIITAVMYEKEIINILKKNHFKGTIITLAPYPKVLK